MWGNFGGGINKRHGEVRILGYGPKNRLICGQNLILHVMIGS